MASPTPPHATVTQHIQRSRRDLIQDRAPNERTSNLYLRPSSSTEGFFQAPPAVLNQSHDDIAFQRALKLFLPASVREELTPELSSFGDKVLSPKILGWVLDAEKHAPYLKTWDTFGKRRDDLVTSEGWRNLQAFGIAEGMVAISYENRQGEYSRLHNFAKYHLWTGSSAWVTCPTLMVDGVAALFRTHLSDPNLPSTHRKVLRSAYDRLMSRDPEFAWTTGQWMTERAGGSDVSQTETLATYSPDPSLEVRATDGSPLGPWLVNGFKWFSSATDANMMVFLARAPEGISTFFAPMRKTLPKGTNDVLGSDTELNGIHIQRLKSKLGTRALPTAELELKGVRAYLIGEEGRGTKQIATVLNIARIHNGFTAIGLWGRGLGVVRALVRVRKVGQRPLWEKTAFMHNLARMHVEYRANVLFNYFVAALLGCVEQDQIAAFHGGKSKGSVGRLPGVTNVDMAIHILRLLTPALKGITAKTAISGLSECMECMGGVGYLENEDMQFNIARLYRDANVLSIWEGTTDMMAHDVLRVLYGKTRTEVLAAMDSWLQSTLRNNGNLQEQKQVITDWWSQLTTILQNSDKENVEMKSRDLMQLLGDIVQGALLVVDAESDGDTDAKHALDAWTLEKTSLSRARLQSGESWTDIASRNMRVVFGAETPVGPRPKL